MTALNVYLLLGLLIVEACRLDPDSEAHYRPRVYLLCVGLWPLVVAAVLTVIFRGKGRDNG